MAKKQAKKAVKKTVKRAAKKIEKPIPGPETKTMYAFEAKEFNVVNGQYRPSVIIHHESENAPFENVSITRRPELDIQAVK